MRLFSVKRFLKELFLHFCFFHYYSLSLLSLTHSPQLFTPSCKTSHSLYISFTPNIHSTTTFFFFSPTLQLRILPLPTTPPSHDCYFFYATATPSLPRPKNHCDSPSSHFSQTYHKLISYLPHKTTMTTPFSGGIWACSFGQFCVRVWKRIGCVYWGKKQMILEEIFELLLLVFVVVLHRRRRRWIMGVYVEHARSDFMHCLFFFIFMCFIIIYIYLCNIVTHWNTWGSGWSFIPPAPISQVWPLPSPFLLLFRGLFFLFHFGNLFVIYIYFCIYLVARGKWESGWDFGLPTPMS